MYFCNRKDTDKVFYVKKYVLAAKIYNFGNITI